MASTPDKTPPAGTWTWLIAGVLVLLVLGLLFFSSSSLVGQQPRKLSNQPDSAKTSSNPATLVLLGAYLTPEGVQVKHFVRETDLGSEEFLRVYNPTDAPQDVQLLLNVPKSTAQSASEISFEGIDPASVVVLEDDPVLLLPLSLYPSQEFADIVIKTARKKTQELREYLRIQAARAGKKVTRANYQQLQSQGDVVALGTSSPTSASPTLLPDSLPSEKIQKDFRDLYLTDKGYALFKPDSLEYPVIEFRRGSPELTDGNALLSFRYLLPAPINSIPKQKDFVLSPESSAFAEIVKITDPVPVTGSDKRVWEFDVLLKLRQTANIYDGLHFRDFPALRAHLTPFIPEVPDDTLFAHEQLAKDVANAVTSPFRKRKAFDIVLQFKGHTDLVHAGYFLNYQLEKTAVRPNVVFLSNNLPRSMTFDVCGTKLTLPSHSAKGVPIIPRSTCLITYGQGKEFKTLVLNDVNNFAMSAADAGALAGYQKEQSCAFLPLTLSDLFLYFDEQVRSLEPHSFQSVFGDKYSFTAVVRTSLDAESCKLPEPFDTLGLKNGRAYAVTLSTPVLVDGGPVTVKAEPVDADGDLKAILAKSWWQDELNQLEVVYTG